MRHHQKYSNNKNNKMENSNLLSDANAATSSSSSSQGDVSVGSTDETICCFRLVIPNFEVELDSSQFNIFYNVSRNLLLAPPPVHAQKVMETGKKLTESKEKGIVIKRDVYKVSVYVYLCIYSCIYPYSHSL